VSETVTGAVEKVSNTPSALVRRYSRDFTEVLPSHIKPETWVRLATGALKRGKRVSAPGGGQCTELELAAQNNPPAFMAALLEAARLGLEPGTEQFYLTPRKVKDRLEVLGLVGYQGYIELMYRAGAVSSVVAEVVCERDQFVWKPGQLDTQYPPRWEGAQTIPLHEIDWDRDDRGPLKYTYAYARMINGDTSKVVVLNRADIRRIKEKSQGAKSEYSPWQTNEPAMWLKSSVRQLRKWVPTSPEWLTKQLQAAKAAGVGLPLQNSQGEPLDLTGSQESGGLDDFVDGEVIEDTEWPEVVPPGSGSR
jgi:recombination protein RecT